jgi:NAD(P)-dependent dehydrogenase (short-subunit alcohol dehydrogenase family)
MTPTQDFDGKVVLVTGGAGGIGAAAAEIFAGRGASVVVADRNVEGAAATVATIRAAGGTATEHAVDVADAASVDALVDATVAAYGRIDCAFNNAGISPAVSGFADVTVDDWQRVIAINLTGVFWCMQAELRQMLRQGDGGAIVNTSSGAGVVVAPGQPAYTAAKHGVLGLTKAAAQEYARSGIRVNAILPGTTDTPMLQAFMAENPQMEKLMRRTTATGEFGRADQVAEAAVWLCSDAASFVSGDSMLVDGGQVCR